MIHKVSYEAKHQTDVFYLETNPLNKYKVIARTLAAKNVGNDKREK